MGARRDELVDLAGRVLEEVGLEEFGMGAIARAAGVKPPSLYKHFDGLDDVRSALVTRSFADLADAFAVAHAGLASSGSRDRLDAFARVYREHALAHPQRYRLSTERPIDRSRIAPGLELAAEGPLLALFDETEDRHPRARAAWAAAHGLVQLEIAGRFPPGTDVADSWRELVDALAFLMER